MSLRVGVGVRARVCVCRVSAYRLLQMLVRHRGACYKSAQRPLCERVLARRGDASALARQISLASVSNTTATLTLSRADAAANVAPNSSASARASASLTRCSAAGKSHLLATKNVCGAWCVFVTRSESSAAQRNAQTQTQLDTRCRLCAV